MHTVRGGTALRRVPEEDGKVTCFLFEFRMALDNHFGSLTPQPGKTHAGREEWPMRYRHSLIGPIVFAATVITVSAQPVAKTATTSKAWKQPMTSWGDPDLQGVWPSTSMLQTPMERAPKLGTRAALTDEEVAQKTARDKQFHQLETGNPKGFVPLAAGWFDYGQANR